MYTQKHNWIYELYDFHLLNTAVPANTLALVSDQLDHCNSLFVSLTYLGQTAADSKFILQCNDSTI